MLRKILTLEVRAIQMLNDLQLTIIIEQNFEKFRKRTDIIKHICKLISEKEEQRIKGTGV